MSINFDDEELLPLSKAARLLPVVRGEKPPHPATLSRWTTTGIRAASGKIIKLKTVFVGGTRMTKPAWIKDFLARRNDVDDQTLSETTEQEEKLLQEQAAQSMRRMREAGLIDAPGRDRDPMKDRQLEDGFTDDDADGARPAS
jgi:hypothetical protein